MPFRVTFRLYEELNEFLPDGKRKKPFDLDFNTTITLKEVLVQLSIPLEKIDLILVNGKVEKFGYRLKPDDYISVYPVFESFDLNTVKKQGEPLRETRFILDVHLGKLAHYLRILGFDSLYRNNLDDNEIIEISLTDKRIILTRDKGLLNNKLVTHGYFINNQKPPVQLEEVLERFDLRGRIKPFTICPLCNGAIREIAKENILSRLQPLTIKHFEKFFKCENCGHIYWEGSHFEKITAWIKGLRII
ncbi:MAG: hypothetical protein JXB00_03615 [Bacteroidales bacterium]|nr:hypothetical protein [Bacteroidales bacterium]